MTADYSVSLESLVARLRSNGGPANLTAAELERVYLHRRAMNLTTAEVETLEAARRISGRAAG